MSDVQIKQFYVRYKGQKYGAGSVIYDMPDDLAKKLAEESNGTIEILPKRGAETVPAPAAALPPVNPAATVK